MGRKIKFVLFIIVLFVFCTGFMGACGMGVGSLMSSADEDTGPKPISKLNYYNSSNKQECIDRGHHWEKIADEEGYLHWKCI
jgi:hypothetical protein